MSPVTRQQSIIRDVRAAHTMAHRVTGWQGWHPVDLDAVREVWKHWPRNEGQCEPDLRNRTKASAPPDSPPAVR
jgi:hypothetical protein